MTDFWSTASKLSGEATPFVVVTLVTVRGHAPQEPGAKMLVTAEGLRWGTVGGGKLEARAIEHAQSLLARPPAVPAPDTLSWNLHRDLGMSCGGEATLLFEMFHRHAWKIVVFGAGHVGQALIRALDPLSCQLTCIDSRQEWLDQLPSRSKLRTIRAENPVDTVETLDGASYFVVMTQGHAADFSILSALLARFPDVPYVGAIGSRLKSTKLRADLEAAGISRETVARLHCPIGLPLGTNDPAEIAISIAAELIQTRDSRRAPVPGTA